MCKVPDEPSTMEQEQPVVTQMEANLNVILKMFAHVKR